MKHILSISLLVLTTCTISTMDRRYLLPIEATITKRLWDAGFSNFAKESKMGTKLNNQCITPISLWGKIQDILTEYKNAYPDIIATWDHQNGEPYPPKCPQQSQLMRIVLQDNPNAVQALERNQWIENTEKIVGVYRYPGMGKK